MTKAKMLGGVLVAALAMVGCAGGATGGTAAELDQTVVSSAIDGRTDLFLDPAQSSHLLTADEVNGSPTAIAVEVQLTESELIAWRAQPSVAVADRSRTEADIVARFEITGTVDLSTAVAIGNETHPGDPSQVVIPGGQLGGFRGSHSSGSSSAPPLRTTPTGFFRINWGAYNGIPNETERLPGLINAHPGCA